MRIFHVIAGLGVGGAEHYLRRFVLATERTGSVEHIVVSLTTVGAVGVMLRDAGVAVEALGMRSMLGLPSALLQLRRMLLALRPDVVQGWMYHGDLVGGLAARWARQGRVVWNVRGSVLVQSTPWATRATRWMCARLSSQIPDVIVCVAEAGRRSHEALGYDATKIRVIPNGFLFDDCIASSPDDLASRTALGVAGDALVVGWVGRFHPAKGIEHFVHAAGLLAQHQSKVRFVMVGRGLDTSNAELMGWLSHHGVSAQVTLLGEQRDVKPYLALMDLFVLSSRAEGFPNVVGEAMAAGVPCVVTDVGDAALLVGDTGIVVPPNDAPALAHAMDSMLTLSESERLTRGATARARVRNVFSLEQSIDRYRQLYAELSGNQAVLP